jgi:hypothetical protein
LNVPSISTEVLGLGSTFPGVFKIKVENEDKDMNPVFRIEDSIFKGKNTAD